MGFRETAQNRKLFSGINIQEKPESIGMGTMQKQKVQKYNG